MSIAPLAVLGIAQTAFSLIGALTDSAARVSSRNQAFQTQTPAAQVQESIWHQLGQEADIRSLTREEMAKVSQLLYDNGAITLADHATMSLDPSFSGSAELLTAPDSSGRIDWMAEFQARLEQHGRMGDTQAAENDQRVLEIFSRLQAGANGVMSLRV